MSDCNQCRANDALILKLKQEIVRLKSRVATYKKKAQAMGRQPQTIVLGPPKR